MSAVASSTPTVPHRSEELESVVIRFVGDSGDGMQLTGSQFTSTSAQLGNDLATFPDFPAEIRAPAGTLAGVSGFQLHFASKDVFTPGDAPDVLVAMNPAALKVNVADLKVGGILVVNIGAFTQQNFDKCGYKSNPLEDGSLEGKYRIYKVDISKMTANALAGGKLSSKEVGRCKNFFALGLMYWMFSRPLDATLKWIGQKFGKTPEFQEANEKALRAGYNFGETTELIGVNYNVPASTTIAPGEYRNITGNSATALGFVTAANLAGLKLFLGSYPITPASDILHELSTFKHHNVFTFQAEDEIAAIGTALGASFGGSIGITSTSGPGLALKAETVGFALMTELPLVVIDVQRGGPSTGLPTKTEQADLLQAMFGRNSESPVPIIAAATPSDCFFMAIEAVRIATKYMTPVIYLTDGYLGNGAEPWLLPKLEELQQIEVKFRTEKEGFYPYLRDPVTLARPWVRPGTPGLEHRVGGLEKDFLTGNVSYDPINHERMVRIRAEKVAGIAKDIPPAKPEGAQEGDLLVCSWGGTYGAIHAAVDQLVKKGKKVGHLHFRHLNPFPQNTEEVLSRFRKVLVPELNMGQLSVLLRARYCTPTIGFNKIQGKPFKVAELIARIEELLGQPN
jgi:2-oxoglutarate ferredoxin oxidoreductase subunit alpha